MPTADAVEQKQPGAAKPPRQTAGYSRLQAALAAMLVAFAVVSCGACHPVYVARVGLEGARFLYNARPIGEVAATADEPTRRQLELVLAARDFAAANGLTPGGSYRKISDTTSSAPYFVVTAAWADRLEPYLWWYPVVGKLPYRGYFDPERAEAYAAGLRTEGLDTRIVRASAYSTLGWFDDPLPSGLLEYSDVGLVVTVLHELVHTTFFATSDAAFSETLANAVGIRLALEFFEQRGKIASAAGVREYQERWLARSEIFDHLAAELNQLFARCSRGGCTRDEMLRERAALYAAAQERLRTRSLVTADDALVAKPLENAGFLAAWRYARRAGLLDHYVAGFEPVGASLSVLQECLRGEAEPFEVLAEGGCSSGGEVAASTGTPEG